MKIANLTAALLGLSLSASFGGECHSHSKVSFTVHGGHIEVGSKESLLSRLAIAPMQYHCASNVPSVRNATAAACSVRLLGKIDYCFGSSWLDCHGKAEIDRMILHSGMPLGPDTLLVVLGYADRTGCPDSNVRLTESRAISVKKHLDHLNWGHRLGIQTTTVAMGEEIQFCNYNLGHNRIAEIWMLTLPRPMSQVINVQPVATHLLSGPAPSQVVALSQAPTQSQVIVSQAPQQILQQAPQQIQLQAPPQIQLHAPQQILPQAPQQILPQAPQQILPQAPQQILPQAPQQILPQAPQQILPQAPQQILPQAPQQILPQAPQQILPQAPQQILPQAPQQILPQAPQQILPQAPQQMQPQAPQQMQPQAPQQFQPQAPEQIQPQSVMPQGTQHQHLAEFLERNIVLAPNADANEFARHLNVLKTFGNPGSN